MSGDDGQVLAPGDVSDETVLWAVLDALPVDVTILDEHGNRLYTNSISLPGGTQVQRTVRIDGGPHFVVRTRIAEDMPQALVDPRQLDQLVERLGSRRLADDVLSSFLDGLPERLEVLASDDLLARRAAASSIRSSALMFGANQLADACFDGDDVANVDELTTRLGRVVAVIEEWRSASTEPVAEE